MYLLGSSPRRARWRVVAQRVPPETMGRRRKFARERRSGRRHAGAARTNRHRPRHDRADEDRPAARDGTKDHATIGGQRTARPAVVE